jgi:hypothetical protein
MGDTLRKHVQPEESAMMGPLEHPSLSVVVPMYDEPASLDADLQDPPEVSPKLDKVLYSMAVLDSRRLRKGKNLSFGSSVLVAAGKPAKSWQDK